MLVWYKADIIIISSKCNLFSPWLKNCSFGVINNNHSHTLNNVFNLFSPVLADVLNTTRLGGFSLFFIFLFFYLSRAFCSQRFWSKPQTYNKAFFH